MKEEIIFNTQLGRYEMQMGGHVVFANIRREGDTVTINHVEAPPELRGTGAAGRFMEKLLQHLRAQKLDVVPVCGYAAAWMRKHPGA